MVVHEQDVYPRLHVSVLIGVIEENHVGVLRLVFASDALYAVAAVLVHRHMHIGEFLLHLIRLVAYLAHRGRLSCKYVATATFTLSRNALMRYSTCGVLPDPPTVMLPTDITGISKLRLFRMPSSNIWLRSLTPMP